MIIIALYFIAMAFGAVAAWLSMSYRTPSLNGWMAFAVLFMLVLIRVIDKLQRRVVSMNKKSLIIVAFVLLCASPTLAVADVQLNFSDGTCTVWESLRVKGKQLCTDKAGLGEYCVMKADVKKVIEVAAGTECSEYSVSSVGDSSTTMTTADRDALWKRQDAQDRQDSRKKRAGEVQDRLDNMGKKSPSW